ncbi:MAG TPA: formate dehydrogenase accessory sulfurtransferase FdhD [Cyclobacteriaceae bacterium]|nr:formate dehydrogenase accessory sulfurtransferase FdhD [Cyclobacteriaceae bacterium]HRK53154.1 formate dehydrogenase accessory sulfurtransferase FdhD [Cyclobacteriaceae bacterium]
MSLSVKPIEITKVSEGGSKVIPDLMAVEEPLEIRIGYGALGERQQKSLSVTMRTPGHDYELAIGFLFTEGIIDAYDQVELIKYCEDAGRQEERENVVRIELKPGVNFDLSKLQRNFYTSSSCGVCGKSSIEAVHVTCTQIQDNINIERKVIHGLSDKLRDAQQIFEHTGGLHAVGLFDLSGKLLLTREDVGRHNAMDKIVGACLFKNVIPLSKTILLVSGRASFELVQKGLRAGVPIMAAVGAPSSLAVTLAKDLGMTLLGFVRGGSFNIYCGAQRIDSKRL